MAASANPILQSKAVRDPTLFCTAFKRPRFYMFTRSEPEYVVFKPHSLVVRFLRASSDSISSLPSFLPSCLSFSSYSHTSRDSKGHNDRDVLNEKPSREEQTLAVHEGSHAGKGANSPFAHSAVIHTTLGDMHCKLFPQYAPKAVENFVGHARSGYYENVIFHRVIKKFVSDSTFLTISLWNLVFRDARYLIGAIVFLNV